MIRKVEIHSNDGRFPDVTGHWIEAETEEAILKTIKRHGISKPIGRDLTNAEVIVCDNDFLEDCHFEKGDLVTKSYLKGKVWFEENGELRSIPIKERYKQLLDETNESVSIIEKNQLRI